MAAPIVAAHNATRAAVGHGGGRRATSTAALTIHEPDPPPLNAVPRLLALSTLARMPQTAIGVLLILRVRELDGSFQIAGLVTTSLGISLAVGAPLLGRLIDRHGQTGVLVAAAMTASAAIVVAGVLPAGVAPWVLLPIAMLVGLTMPPISACVRALIGHLLDVEARHGALALEAALQEISFIAGPLVFVTLLAASSPGAGLVGAGVWLLAGALTFAASSESRLVPSSSAVRPPGGALVAPGLRTVLAVASCLGIMYGATEVALVAATEGDGGTTTLGVLLVAWALPSLLSGLWVARRGAPDDLPRALVLLVGSMGLLTAALALMPSLWLLGLMLATAGAVAAPMFGALSSLVGAVAREGTITEAYTWAGSGMFGGVAVGGGIGGALVAAAGPEAAYVAGGAVVVLGAVVAGLRVATLTTPAA
jgi:MFS family permease